MSRYFSQKYKNLVPYMPGEQPKDFKYIKLNTNESPFAPSPAAQKLAKQAVEGLQLYSDPECRVLTETAAEYFGISHDRILFTNGSDEILNFAFMAFCDGEHPAFFPDITYGFYEVFAQLVGVPYEKIPLKDDFTIDINDYADKNGTVFIANPNAPTGIALSLGEVEQIVKQNSDRVVVVDEAYVDFGAQSAVPLTDKYDNLLVTQTFSKSRSLAGARLGYGIACASLINDLNTIKYSTNPYNINSMTMAAGIGSFEDNDYFVKNCSEIAETREYTAAELKKAGFSVLNSKANFLFAAHPEIAGKQLYFKLKEKGILIRHFETPRLKDYNRITIGSREQMDTLLKTISEILEVTV